MHDAIIGRKSYHYSCHSYSIITIMYMYKYVCTSKHTLAKWVGWTIDSLIGVKLYGPLIAGSYSPPTMMDIICFPLQDSKVDLTKEVGTNYRQFGILLLEDKTGAHISALEKELVKNAQDINYRVFQEWLHGKGRRPVSWEILISVLEDIGLNQLAKSIRDVKL